MTFGVSYALFEQAILDTRTGAFVSRDLAEYHVPVHADIPEIDAILLDGFDDKANALGAKGLGELGICGARRPSQTRSATPPKSAFATFSLR